MKFKMNYENLNSTELRSKKHEVEEQLRVSKRLILDLTKDGKDQNISIERREEIISTLKKEKETQERLKEQLADMEVALGMLEDEEKRQIAKLTSVDMANQERKRKEYADTEECLEEYVNRMKTATEARTITTVDTGLGNGGVTIPTIVKNKIEKLFAEYGQIVSKTKKEIAVGIKTIPYEISITEADEFDEGVASNEIQVQFGSLLLSDKAYAGWMEITDEIRAKSPIDFINYIIDTVGMQIIKRVEKAILVNPITPPAQGALFQGIRGISKYTDTNFVKTISVKELSWKVLTKALSELRRDVLNLPSGLSIVTDNSTYFNNILSETDSTGKPIWDNMLNTLTSGSGPLKTNLIFTEHLKSFENAAAGDPVMIIGNFDSYALGMPYSNDMNIVIDPVTKAKERKTQVIGSSLMSGGLYRPNSFVVITKAAA